VALALSFVQPPVSAWAQRADDQLEVGVKQAEGGEFDAAVVTLDTVARKLATDGSRSKELVRAYTYLGIAYLGLNQDSAARARFLEALKVQPSLRLDPKEFPPKIVQVFEQVRAGQAAAAAAAPAPAPSPSASPAPAPPVEKTAPATTAAASPPPKKGGSKGLLILLGVGGAVGIGAAVAGGGGGGGSSTPATQPPATLPPTASLADLSATVTSAQQGKVLNCKEPALITVALTNRARALVSVSGVRRHQSSVSGGCTSTNDFTYNVTNPAVGTGTADVLNAQQLFSNGVGCCRAGSSCSGSCHVGFTFTVLTSVGEVNAGAIDYGIVFERCSVCSSFQGFGAAVCPTQQ
jgi:hypothetical protein